MAGSFRNRKLVVAFSSVFLSQTDFNTPLTSAQINKRHPQVEPTFPSRIVTREEIRDCSGEYVLREDITSRLARLRFSFDADPYLLAGWLALAQSAVSAPSGSRTNEVQTITPTGTFTSGTWRLGLLFEGVQDYVDIPYNATAGDIQSAIQALRNVRAGGVTVTGTVQSGPIVITAAGRMAAYDLPLFTIDVTNIVGGGTLPIAQTTAGVPKIANIARTTAGQNLVTSIIVGFDGDTTPPDRYKDVVVNEVIIRGQLRGKVTVELEVIASLDTDPMTGYVMPACVNIAPVYTKDCRVKCNGNFIVSNLREFTYTYRNNIFTGDDPFPYDDIDVVRLEHGDRTSTFTWSQYGTKGDTEYALGELESIVANQLIVGAPANRVIVDMPASQMQLDDNVVSFAGEANRSMFTVNAQPRFDGVVAGSPDRVYYYGPETTTFGATS